MTKITRDLKSEIKQICNELLTEDLSDKVCGNISAQLDSKMEVINAKLAKLDALDVISKQIAELNNSFKSLANSVDSNKKEIINLNKSNDVLVQHSKKNCLRFHGFQESEGENVLEMVKNFINEALKVPCAAQDIDSAFRIGKTSVDSAKPRTILVNFVNNWKRSQVFNLKKSLKKLGTNISIFEDLTKQRYDLLLAAKKKYGQNQAWSSGGKIYAMHHDKKILVNGDT